MKISGRGRQSSQVRTEGWRPREEQVCAESGLFDRDWYLLQDPRIATSGIDPVVHYIRLGAAEGLDPNPLFDTDWYLEQNPDIAAAGMNPLSHYIQWGAGKGLDPSPLFQTSWYLEQYPDVAAAGLNPLTHYIRHGAAEFREPISPIRKFFAKLASKPTQSSAELERLLHTYSSPPDIAPAKARADNFSQVGVYWAERFLAESVEQYRAGQLEAALRSCKYAMQTLPHEDDPIALYSHMFSECNRGAIATFVNRFARTQLLVVHVSHQQAIPVVERSCQTFYDPSGTIDNLIVVGDPQLPEDFFAFDDMRSILVVPARDSYEALPQKVAKTYAFIGHCPVEFPIVKVDDDAICRDVRKLGQLAVDLMPHHLYGGRVNPRSSPHNCSVWHFGKCTDKSIDVRPDGLISTSPYAGGQGYWLNAAAVRALSRIAVIHERHFQVEYFEDRALGTALVQYGVRPHHYDLVAEGVLGDTSQPEGLVRAPPFHLRGARRADDANVVIDTDG